MSALFTADVIATREHFFKDIPVADFGCLCRNVVCLGKMKKAEIVMTVTTAVSPLSDPAFCIACAQMAMILSPSTSTPFLIHRQTAVCIAIKGKSQIAVMSLDIFH